MKTLFGKLAIRPWGEGGHDTLYCGDRIIVEWALQLIGPTENGCSRRSYGRLVSFRYWTAKAEVSPGEIKKNAVECFHTGSASVEWEALYSGTADYVGIDEELMISGCDLLDELSDFAGDYLLLELTVHDGPRSDPATFPR